MIEDPIVIRKSRNKLVVSSSNPKDPIQLVREIADNQLEIHLKNGSKYIEHLTKDDDIQEIILELMGYSIVEVVFHFHAWPSDQEGILNFCDQPAQLEYIGEQITDYIFAPTPYLNSKFLMLEIESFVENSDIKHYDSTYSNYDVEVAIRFRARVDMVDEINDVFYQRLPDITLLFFRGQRYHTSEYDCSTELDITVV